jgi:hypothetical protein
MTSGFGPSKKHNLNTHQNANLSSEKHLSKLTHFLSKQQFKITRPSGCYNPSSPGGVGRRIVALGWPLAKTTRPYLKNNPVVGHLPSKHEALSSNSSTANKQKSYMNKLTQRRGVLKSAF